MLSTFAARGLIKLELARALRNRKFLFFSVIYPSVLFLLIAGSADATTKVDGTGLTLPTYMMVSMASFGALTAVLMGNSERIAKERESGWVRQLRLTTLPGIGVWTAKMFCIFHLLRDVLEGCRPELRDALAAPVDALFTVGGEGEEETYRTARRVFHLNMQPNVLHLVERLTPELRRQEVEVWKRAIRVMSHELNNSLAPIRSLSHSARQAAARPEHAALLEGILTTI